MDRQQKRKQPCIKTETHDKNAKRREMYRDMATAKKNALLLQRRLKKREATTNRLLGGRKSINFAESMSTIQENVIVGGSCFISKIATTNCEVFTPLNVLDKEKNAIHPISIFEKGSTSTTSSKSSAPTTEIALVDVANTIAFNSTNEVKEMSKRRRWANYLTCCGYSQEVPASTHPPFTDGILGLGNGKSSIVSQLSGQGGGFLFFGDDVLPSSGTAWTPIVRTSSEKHFSSGPAELFFDGQATGVEGFPVIFNSGSTFSYFSSEAYDILVSLIKKNINAKQLTDAVDDKAFLCAGMVPNPSNLLMMPRATSSH